MDTLVLSDIHLDANDPAKVRRFAQDLAAIAGPDVGRVVLLGDLFDFWFEYRHVVFSGYFEVLRAFAALRDRGIELHLVCGNHDFWAGRFLRDHLGFHIHQDSLTLELDGRRAFMVHGDGYNPRDVGYRAYKRIARAKPVIALFGAIHPDAAMWIARHVSRTSRRLTLQEDPGKGAEAAALAEFARKTLEKGAFDYVLAGHAHAPCIVQFAGGTYVNTGDWMFHRSYVLWNGREFQLLYADKG